jgi:hypothetical protein
MSTPTAAASSDYARNASLEDLVTLLREQRAAVHDFVAPARRIHSVDGVLHVDDAEQDMTDSGVTSRIGRYRPTQVMDDQIAGRLDVPRAYMRRLRAQRIDMYDQTVNGWLHGYDGFGDPERVIPGDPRKFLFRTFRDEAGGEGIGRAFLSDSYKAIDNYDVLMQVLKGINDSGIQARVRAADLTEARMHVRLDCPAITAAAPRLLDGYRNPFTNARLNSARGGDPNDAPGARPPQVGDIVSAGLRITNSEVGWGSFTIYPEIVVLACTNGMTRDEGKFRAVHLGGKLDEGQITWSAETQQKALDLVMSRTKDAVKAFLSEDYLTKSVADIEGKATAELNRPAQEVVQVVGKQLSWSDREQDGILDMFLRGGQATRGGVVNAVTAFSQTVPSADRGFELDMSALRVLDVANI